MTDSPQAAASQDRVFWAEIPVTDMDRAIAFYEAVCQIKLTSYDEGPNPMAVFGSMDQPTVSAHLYPGKPAKDGGGPTVHIAAPGKLEDSLARAAEAGGTVLSEPIPIPPGRFAYILDLDGNSIGLFEPS